MRPLPLSLAELGLIDEYELVVHPLLAGHGPRLLAGLSTLVDLTLVRRLELGSGVVAMRYEPTRWNRSALRGGVGQHERRIPMPELHEETAALVRPTLGRITPILRVADLDASVAYYVERLGFSIQWRADPVASVGRDGAALMLCVGDQGQAGAWVWGSTSDADALYAEFQRRGARLRHPPTNYPWGSRECQVSDPDGHVLRFGADLLPGEPMGEWLDGEGRRWLPLPDGGWRLAD